MRRQSHLARFVRGLLQDFHLSLRIRKDLNAESDSLTVRLIDRITLLFFTEYCNIYITPTFVSCQVLIVFLVYKLHLVRQNPTKQLLVFHLSRRHEVDFFIVCPFLTALVSDSPIIQNGKLIGAVIYALINDPACGYGIFIENMPAQMGDLAG